MQAIGVIPARLQSSRLPRKLLLAKTGKPLLQYAWEAASAATALDEVIVAADCEEIADCVRRFGGRAELTGEHPSGTDRVAEVVKRCCPGAAIVVNLQGDEPELDPEAINRLLNTLAENPGTEMATLATPFHSAADVRDPACVKAVVSADGRALYFSRSPVPFVREGSIESYFEADNHRPADADRSPWVLHLGIYAYRRDFLLRLTQLPPSRLEQLEKLEQLRALEAGATIRIEIIDEAGVGIDTPEDYARFVESQLSVALDRECA